MVGFLHRIALLEASLVSAVLQLSSSTHIDGGIVTRIPQTFWAWFFLSVIIFRFVPASVVSNPVSNVWSSAIGNPLSNLPRRGRLALAWLGALAITFGTAFGLARPEVSRLLFIARASLTGF